MLAWARENDCRIILIENASRFARDLIVQETGYEMLAREGFTLIAVDDPDAFTADTPTARMVRQILGAVAQFEKASLVYKLRHARERKRAETGRCEGRRPVPEAVVREAKRLHRRSPKTGRVRSLREVAAALERLGHVGPGGKVYGPQSVKLMLAA